MMACFASSSLGYGGSEGPVPVSGPPETIWTPSMAPCECITSASVAKRSFQPGMATMSGTKLPVMISPAPPLARASNHAMVSSVMEKLVHTPGMLSSGARPIRFFSFMLLIWNGSKIILGLAISLSYSFAGMTGSSRCGFPK
jgi:hypothetical protein